MNHIRHIAVMLAGLIAAALTFAVASPAAFAMMVPAPDINGGAQNGPQTPTIVTGGMTGWQIALIAAGSAVLAAVLAVFLDRARAARRNLTVPSA